MSIADTIEDTFADRDPDTIAAAIVTGVCAALADATDPQTITTRTSGGTIFKAIAWQGKLWSLDPDDSTTPHDEITCIRTIDSDGYFTDDVRLPNAILSRSEVTPPDPDDVVPEDRPSYGDAYIPAAGATDEWAGHEDEVAVYTARGWVFKDGTHGDHLLVEDEGDAGEFIHFSTDDIWEDGLPGNLVDLSVRPSALLIRAWAVENQTTNAPPATGPAGEQYIIGGTPTGAWAASTKKIAWRPSTDAAFVITAPFVGEEVYDKALAVRYRWNGTTWTSVTGAVEFKTYSRIFGANNTVSNTGGTQYPYSTTAPTIIQPRIEDLAITRTARAGVILYLNYTFDLTFAVTDVFTVGIRRDNETNCVEWFPVATYMPAGPLSAAMPVHVEFACSVLDALPHTYTLCVFRPQGGAYALRNRLLTLEQVG